MIPLGLEPGLELEWVEPRRGRRPAQQQHAQQQQPPQQPHAVQQQQPQQRAATAGRAAGASRSGRKAMTEQEREAEFERRRSATGTVHRLSHDKAPEGGAAAPAAAGGAGSSGDGGGAAAPGVDRIWPVPAAPSWMQPRGGHGHGARAKIHILTGVNNAELRGLLDLAELVWKPEDFVDCGCLGAKAPWACVARCKGDSGFPLRAVASHLMLPPVLQRACDCIAMELRRVASLDPPIAVLVLVCPDGKNRSPALGTLLGMSLQARSWSVRVTHTAPAFNEQIHCWCSRRSGHGALCDAVLGAYSEWPKKEWAGWTHQQVAQWLFQEQARAKATAFKKFDEVLGQIAPKKGLPW